MSFLDELKSLKKIDKLTLEAVEKCKENAMQQAVEKALEQIKEEILMQAKQSHERTITGTYWLKDDYFKKYPAYDLYYTELDYFSGFEPYDSIPYSDVEDIDYRYLTEGDYINYGKYFPFGYKLASDNDIRIHPRYGNGGLYKIDIGVAIYGKIIHEEQKKLFIKQHKYYVKFNKYVHEFTERLAKITEREGISVSEPVCVFFEDGEVKQLSEYEVVIKTDYWHFGDSCGRGIKWIGINYQINY